MTEKKLTPQQAMYKAIIDVCKLDEKLVPRGRFAKFSMALIAAGYTPEMLVDMYGDGGWWYREHWRGQQGNAPTEAHIRNTIGIAKGATRASTVSGESGGVHL